VLSLGICCVCSSCAGAAEWQCSHILYVGMCARSLFPFRNLAKFHEDTKKQHSGLKLPSFPHFGGGLRTPRGSKALEKRKEKLESYLTRLLEHSPLAHDEEVCLFFNITRHVVCSGECCQKWLAGLVQFFRHSVCVCVCLCVCEGVCVFVYAYVKVCVCVCVCVRM
jgi:PX domain